MITYALTAQQYVKKVVGVVRSMIRKCVDIKRFNLLRTEFNKCREKLPYKSDKFKNM